MRLRKKQGAVPSDSKLESKLREVVDACELPISEHKKSLLTEEMTLMIWTWLRKPDNERDQYLRKESFRILYRLGLRRSQFSVTILGHDTKESPSEDDVRKRASAQMDRVLGRINNIVTRGHSTQIPLFAFGELVLRPSYQIKRIKIDGRQFEVLSHLEVGLLPEKVVRKGALGAKRKRIGNTRIAEVQYLGQNPDAEQEDLFAAAATS